MQFCAASSTVEHPTLQSGNGGSTPTAALQFVVRKLSHAQAKPFIETWHYSKRCPTGKNIFFGAFRGEELYAVINYGTGVNPYQARFLGVTSIMELKRMCRIEPRDDRFPLTRFISISLSMLRRENAIQALVSFSDPEQGHEGTVYKAAGFIRHGESNPEWHLIDSSGITRHRRFAYRFARRNKCSIAEARARLGLSRRKTLPKTRWIKRFD
jgi:hypothetical protein